MISWSAGGGWENSSGGYDIVSVGVGGSLENPHLWSTVNWKDWLTNLIFSWVLERPKEPLKLEKKISQRSSQKDFVGVKMVKDPEKRVLMNFCEMGCFLESLITSIVRILSKADFMLDSRWVWRFGWM